MMSFPASFIEAWKQKLKSCRGEQLNDFPNYHLSDVDALVTTSRPRTIGVGTGESIFRTALLPAILSAKREVILVMCFWADSPTLQALAETLDQLVKRRLEAQVTGRGAEDELRIRICFSSRSLLQKLFHTWSRDGHVYPPSEWPKLGLPDQKTLVGAGIQLHVKSLFFLPFSIMHPKFLIVDRQRAWMPSCNVSWEKWFETCVEFDGEAVAALVRFYESVWERKGLDGAGSDSSGGHQLSTVQSADEPSGTETSLPVAAEMPASAWKPFGDARTYPTLVLPSSHHVNPRFRFLPFLKPSPPPTTPLNAALLTLFTNAQHDIVMLTPNVTTRAVISSLLSALRRGVNVHICTNRSMMPIEQLVTAGTMTEWTLRSLIKKYNHMCDEHPLGKKPRQRSLPDLEASHVRPGHLEIMYYRPRLDRRDPDEPVLSHMKMTLVDGQYLVLGSGNMDRASWFTSQELGILFYMPGFEHDVWTQPLNSRLEVRYRGYGVDENRGDRSSESRGLTAGSLV